MAGKKQKQEGVGAWIAIVILFAVGLWPIALVMLLVKLFGNDGQKRRQAPPPLPASAGMPQSVPRPHSLHQRPVAPQGRARPVSVTGRPSSSQVHLPPYLAPTNRCSRYPSTDGARPVV